MGYVVEKVFAHKNLLCCVDMMDLGHRCGYVGVPKGHKFYGKDYMDVEDKIDCHGGLTFSSRYEDTTYPLKEPNDYWWFGWDYGHYGDGIDWESFERLFDSETVHRKEMWGCGSDEDRIYYLYNVVNDCIKVAEQLIKIGEEDGRADNRNIINREIRNK